jgi:hypothetical protein
MKPMTIPIILALATALCWGLYGPTIANARSEAKPPAYSPFKPYVGVGLAYLVIAVVGGLVAMKLKGDSFAFFAEGHSKALSWGFLAGAAGALGALALTTAMLTGGKDHPQVVMSFVFGGAVTVTAIVSVIQTGTKDVKPGLWIGIAGIIISSILVAYFTPSAHPAPAPGGEATKVASQTSH